MAIYHLDWCGRRNGSQTGFYILNRKREEYGRIEWRDGSIRVVHNDGSLFRECGTSHAASFAAASDLIDYCRAAERRTDTTDFPT